MPSQGLQKVGSTAIPAEAPRVMRIMQLRIRERIEVDFLCEVERYSRTIAR